MANTHGTDPTIYEGLASPYGGIDSTALAAQSISDAALLRGMARCSNRVAATGHSLFQYVWNADPALAHTAGAGVNKAYLRDAWYQMAKPITVPKKPGLTIGEVQGWISTFGAGDHVKIQVTTSAAPFQDNVAFQVSPPVNNVVEIVGTGSDTPQLFTLSNIPLDPGSWESIAVYVCGYRPGGDTLGDTSVYTSSGNNSGNGNGGIVGASGSFSDQGGGGWNVPPAADWASGGHYIVFSPNPGIGAPTAPAGKFQITRVLSANDLTFTTATNAPSSTYDPGAGLMAFSIYAYPRVNLQSVAMYAVDRTY